MKLTNLLKANQLFFSKGDFFHNLALESTLLKRYTQGQPILYLWTHGKTVVIGRHQNAWRECNLYKMGSYNIALARRYSGGGAVYQDHGNLCFTFITDNIKDYRKENNKIISRAFQNLGIEIEVKGRNDILLQGRKFSGSAFQLSGNKALHHGTIMVNVNRKALEEFLTPNKTKLQSKGVQSVASRVINVKDVIPDITLEDIKTSIIEEFCKTYSIDRELVEFEIKDLKSDVSLSNRYQVIEKEQNGIDKNMQYFNQIQNNGVHVNTPITKQFADYIPFNNIHIDSDKDINTFLTCNKPEIGDAIIHDQVYKDTYKQLISWEWRYGESPEFSTVLEKRFDWGSFQVHLDVDSSLIKQAKVYSDCLDVNLVNLFQERLHGVRCIQNDIYTSITAIDSKNSIERDQNIEEFAKWISVEAST
ncbi:lipoate-protein ligase A, putative [Cryptosporidium muris RN66]|uniref:lipoate--protein ligase n=1 Tax=Cryptosporidium muris (strain RN66) TaxID=441375 RepID=B6ADS1_CRYMR|nr:lipoate-protein ligase A, putative [Cryptosporidium muris RN66]EEA06362.1 lipoate-protein ligase A, putative [Cryptosporidium muris RN66]|eukprot:XP_002140711.1 lipoate-protein ligase A [Cryptosporidium muris RN66]